MRILPSGAVLCIVLLAGCADRAAEEAVVTEDAAVTSAAPATAPAGDLQADVEEVGDYELNMEDMRRWVEATRNLQRAAAEHPELAAKQENQSDYSNPESLDEMEATYNGIPEAREAIEASGLDVRDYVVIGFAFMQSSMAAGAVGSGVGVDSVSRAMKVRPDNIEFVRENQAELGRLMQQLHAEQ